MTRLSKFKVEDMINLNDNKLGIFALVDWAW